MVAPSSLGGEGCPWAEAAGLGSAPSWLPQGTWAQHQPQNLGPYGGCVPTPLVLARRGCRAGSGSPGREGLRLQGDAVPRAFPAGATGSLTPWHGGDGGDVIRAGEPSSPGRSPRARRGSIPPGQDPPSKTPWGSGGQEEGREAPPGRGRPQGSWPGCWGHCNGSGTAALSQPPALRTGCSEPVRAGQGCWLGACGFSWPSPSRFLPPRALPRFPHLEEEEQWASGT